MINIKDKLRRSNVLFSRAKIENVNYADRGTLAEDESNLNAEINDINNIINNSVTNDAYNATISQLNRRINEVTEQVDNIGEIVKENSADISVGIILSGSTFTTIPKEFIFSNAENLNNVLEDCTNLTFADIDMSSAKSAKYMFDGCTSLEGVNLKSDKLIDGICMFNNCKSLSNLPNIDLSNLELGGAMFANTPITAIPNYNLKKCRDLSVMFQYCKNLVSPVDLELDSATNLYAMFDGCTSLTDVKLKNLSNVTNMQAVFNGCKNLEKVELIDTNKLKDADSLFLNCNNLTDVVFTDLENLEDGGRMFEGCTNLQTIELINTKNLIVGGQLFMDCNNLTDVIITDLENLADGKFMFDNCSKLKNLTFPSNTNNLLYMAYMFGGCYGLTEIPLITITQGSLNSFTYCYNIKTIPQFNLIKAYNVNGMFKNCYNLETIPLLDFSSVQYCNYTFYTCRSLKNLGGFKNLKVGFDLEDSPLLTYQSVLNVINNAYDFKANSSTTTKTIKLHSDVYALLSEDDFALANNKGWVISK